MKAILRNYRQSPRKVRLVADLVKGKDVKRALAELDFVEKRASGAIKKLINSAVANAEHNFSALKENLIIKEMRVDQGVTLKRYMPRARGRAMPIKKRTSHVLIVLEDASKREEKKTTQKEENKKEKTVAEKPKKKVATKAKKETKTKKSK